MSTNFDGHPKVRRILVAYDDSDSSKRAVRLGVELARLYGAELTVISVIQLPEPATMVETTALLESGIERYEKSFEELRSVATLQGVELATRVVAGHVAEQIVHVAAEEKIDLIIMGHRGKSLIQQWLLGSVSKRVISYAPCSVLIVR